MSTIDKPWLVHYPKEIPQTIEYEERTLHDYLKQSAELHPSQSAVHFLGKELTFQEVYEQAKRFANQLKALGVEKGDRVALMLPNSPQSLISYYGTLMLGAVVVQTNPLYVERELEHQLIDSGQRCCSVSI